jgi:hypothetical protein
VIWIPEDVWNDLLGAFAAAPSGVERVAYLDGVVINEAKPAGVVTTLVIPKAELQPGRYVISADAMSSAARHMRPNRLRRLVQVHTHGSDFTLHSCIDDRDAYSQHNGAASLVLPAHATSWPMPAEGTLHIRRDDGWRPLRGDDIRDVLRVVPSVIDQSDHHPEGAGPCPEPDSVKSRRTGIQAPRAALPRLWRRRDR